MKKVYYVYLIFLALVPILLNAQSIQIGSSQFPSVYTVGSLNDFGPLRTSPNGPAAARYALIYPSTLLTAIPNNTSISSLEFFRTDAVAAAANLAGNAQVSIYLRNVTAPTFADTGRISWTSRISGATLVYQGSADWGAGATGWKRVVLTTPYVFNRTNGDNLEVLIQYTQSAGQPASLTWGYSNSAATPEYLANSSKTVLLNDSVFANDTLVNTNLRKPTMRINFPFPINVSSLSYDGTQVIYTPMKERVAATFRNTGTNASGQFTASVTGPGGYSSTKTIASLLSGDTALVEFDSVFYNTLTPGDYTFQFVTTLANDPFAGDDTLRVPIKVINPISETGNLGSWNNGAFITSTNGGFGGAPISALHSGLSTFGNNVNNTSWRMHEDFILPAGSDYTIDSLVVYAYQTGAVASIPTFTEGFAGFWDKFPGDPTANFLAGDTVNSVLFDNFWTGAYRVSSTAFTDTTRPIMRVTIFVFPVVIQGGGRMYASWSLSGSLTSGPWNMPISHVGLRNTGNAIIRNSTAGYSEVTDGGTLGRAGMTMEVHYTKGPTSTKKVDPLLNSLSNPFPNPNNGNFSMIINLNEATNIKAEIIDLQGKVLQNKDFGNISGQQRLDFNQDNLAAGMYLVQIYHNGFKTTKKVQIF